jgi:hypothetical protein
MQHRLGFTLIELSIVLVVIVLVVIGLVIGGIIAGKELIEVSKVRAELSQIDKFRVAEDLFKAKYGDLPGDISTEKAADLNLIRYWGSTPTISDGKISGYTASDRHRTGYFGQEHHLYFLQLSKRECLGLAPVNGAGLLDITLDSSALGNKCNFEGNPAIGPGITLPRSKLNPEFGIMPVTAVPFSQTTWYILNAKLTNGWQGLNDMSLTPLQAFQLDSKVDDGRPGTGSVRAYQYSSTHTDFGYNDRYIEIDDFAGDCVVDAAATRYNVTDPELLCAIIVKK